MGTNTNNGPVIYGPSGKPLKNRPYGKQPTADEVRAAAATLGVSSADRIAAGQSNNPLNLPESEIKKMSALGITSPGVTNFITSDDEDYEDTSGFFYNDNNIFSFTGEKNKGKKPNAGLSKLPAQKTKSVTPSFPVVIDKDGEVYQSLGQFNGDLSFLDEQAKNILPPPAGSFLYRKPHASIGTGVLMDYYVGANPQLSSFGGLSFKKIGSKFLDDTSNAIGGFGNAGSFGITSINPGGQTFGFTPNIGTSSLYNFRPATGLNTFNNLSAVKPVGLGSFYNAGNFGGTSFGYSADGKPKVKDIEPESTAPKGTGFEKVASGIASIANAGAAVINALKSNKPQIPVSASNGDMAGYIAAQNAGANSGGWGGLGGFGTFDDTESGYDVDGSPRSSGSSSKNNMPQSSGSSKTLLYVVGALVVAGVAFYFIKNKK